MYDVAPDDAQAAQLDQHVGARARLAGGTKPPAAAGNIDDSASVPAAIEIDPRLTVYQFKDSFSSAGTESVSVRPYFIHKNAFEVG